MSDAFGPTYNRARLSDRGKIPRATRSADFDKSNGNGGRAMSPCARCRHPAFWHNLNPAEGCLWRPAFNDPKRETYEGCGCEGMVRP